MVAAAGRNDRPSPCALLPAADAVECFVTPTSPGYCARLDIDFNNCGA